ncbi:MAG: 16S rRNA (cytosine(967)-C(5))-methyltransferase RsmB [Candidatus Cloacimonadota bacterium]|nr:16S rRNA (cytosine(967)-C(5))-methyltransferase RsmB [Candidatus Cloacimonadota bacterium]
MNTRDLTFLALREVLSRNKNSDQVFAEICNKNALYGRDKKFFYAMTKGIIKRKIYLDYIIDFIRAEFGFYIENDDLRNVLRLGLYQLIFMDSVPNYAAVSETVNLCKSQYSKKSAGKVNAFLQKYLQNKNIELPKGKNAFLSVKYSFPISLIRKWLRKYGEEDTIKMCKYFNAPAKLHVRFNPDKISYEDFSKHLDSLEVKYTKSEYFPYLIRMEQNFDFISDEMFKKGFYYLQDESTVFPPLLLDPQKGEKILDICAAPGGKAFMMSAILHDSNQIYVNDVSEEKLEIIKENANRLKCNNLKYFCEDAREFHSSEKFDKILADVPCSGLGVMRRKPEIRLRFSADSLLQLLDMQQQILENCAKLIKTGGVIVYSTCTFNGFENENQIEKFLDKHKNFVLDSPEAFVDKNVVIDKYIKTYPFKHDMDGSFAARLRKVN